MASRFKHKSVWHSVLAAESPVALMFTGEVRPSKFSGKPPFIPFKIQGDDGEFLYQVENETIERLLTNAPQNVWITVTFAGSRDAAVVSWDGSPAPGPASAPPTNDRPASNGEPLSRTYFEALQTAAAIIDRICADYEKVPTDDAWLSAVHAAAASLYIEHNKNGRTRPIRKGT